MISSFSSAVNGRLYE